MGRSFGGELFGYCEDTGFFWLDFRYFDVFFECDFFSGTEDTIG